ncbi:transcription factor bHLH94-like [Phragmites australis]|uniref:transcription factor bHLH94-like n=1 Tax=Phragmites australis TaxID=29695 RepID=UPI002D794333|nr:transcription factor bHLH94-like [Phragmites australis]
MALEAVVFSQAGHFGYGRVDSPYALPWCDLGGGGGGGFGELCAADWDHELVASVAPSVDEWETVSTKDLSSEASMEGKAVAEPAVAAGRRKRRRNKVVKNKEEIESQRMTHIAVERNRRRQMNEYLAVLRSLMPPSYAHRGDQASIVGGAINYVRELEQLLQSLEVQKSIKNMNQAGCTDNGSSPFVGVFSFPQYSTSSHGCCGATSIGCCSNANSDAAGSAENGRPAAAVADIEVTMVEGHASLKVLARRRPKQLLKLVAGLQQLRIPPLHLNMTTVHAMVLYTFSLKVEDDSKMGSVEDIATAVHEILSSIARQEETAVM